MITAAEKLLWLEFGVGAAVIVMFTGLTGLILWLKQLDASSIIIIDDDIWPSATVL